MRLSGIKLAGFKSFVDPSSLPLPTNLTGVVGPNGCGKSNIIDAVRWVLGETSMKNLRSADMEDVIFNGSKTRKPVGRASVELIFDNSDGQIAGPFAAYAEISVRRELTREPLRGRRVRRTDRDRDEHGRRDGERRREDEGRVGPLREDGPKRRTEQLDAVALGEHGRGPGDDRHVRAVGDGLDAECVDRVGLRREERACDQAEATEVERGSPLPRLSRDQGPAFPSRLRPIRLPERPSSKPNFLVMAACSPRTSRGGVFAVVARSQIARFAITQALALFTR